MTVEELKRTNDLTGSSKTAAAPVSSAEVNPSGKLADTIAYHIEDHPSNENFGRYLYSEDVYKADALDLWNSPLWDKFRDQLTVDEMIEMAYRGGFRTVGIERLGIPATIDNDGPAAIKGSGEGSYTDSGIAYPNDTVLACTWNTDLAKAKGEVVAVEAAAIGTNVWYAPGIRKEHSQRA